MGNSDRFCLQQWGKCWAAATKGHVPPHCCKLEKHLSDVAHRCTWCNASS